ncbi:MAG: DNA-3-methyladenine glycosylase 2 family protein [Candidatus Thiodiazotropha sp. (ex Troendleina suluensis)]|nr:DNA-3-methyladenine glycosylase 2 family protein [Candidatus Thiodiazotropha sp. (ex Troendleina suluensis)]MCU7857255.1 DNA-3-methyladenine glycosylase 2 family protein [Candidatus Thiodiazotropha sp. (ex Lucinoma borealis)]
MDMQDIEYGMEVLARIDPDIDRALCELGPPPPRHRAKGFEALLSIIVSQQISTEVALVIMTRITALVPKMTANGLMSIDDQVLRDAGLSWRKIEYAKGLAEAIEMRHFDVDGLEVLSDKEAIDAITNLRGFGRWSAEIYLMFSLKRQDIFPADDLALQVALGRLKGLSDKPTPKRAREMVKHWSPWRSVGSLFLWHYYRGAPT